MMTDNEIVKAFECCCVEEPRPNCKECPIEGACANCDLDYEVFSLINRQKEEIERLEKETYTPFAKFTFDENKLKEIVADAIGNIEFNLNSVKSEAIKEFAERLKDEMRLEDDCRYDCMNCLYECKGYVPLIDKFVKERTEVQE